MNEELNEPITKEKVMHGEMITMRDNSIDFNQYQKYLNSHLERTLSKMDIMKKSQEEFLIQVGMLKRDDITTRKEILDNPDSYTDPI